MKIIRLEVYYEFLDFNAEDYYVRGLELALCNIYKTEIWNHKFEKELFNQIMEIKLDGVSMDVTSSGNLISIEIHLIYPVDSKVNIKLVETISDWCNEKFISSVEESLSNLRITEEGLLIELVDIYDTEFINDLVEEVNKSGLVCNVVSHQKHTYERGAGDYREAIVLFIASAIGGGIIWDITKGILAKYYDSYILHSDSIKRHKSFDSQNLINKMAELANENPNNMIITNISGNDETGYKDFIIQSRYIRIFVSCDDDLDVKDYRIENLTQTRI